MSQFSSLYDLFLRGQLTRGRLVGLGGLGAIGVAIGAAIGAGDASPTAGADLIDNFGLALVVPVATLVFASAVLGDLIDDGTMVYVWLRPVARWKLSLAAACATLTVVVPLVLVPLVAAAAATGGGSELVLGTAASATLGIGAYTGLFLALGIRVRRSLLWGLMYVFIWEGFVARAGETASRLAVRAYTRSVLSESTSVPLSLADVSWPARLVVPMAVMGAGLAWATRRLRIQDVA